MSGYRQSRYDPTHYEQAGRPLRPFNWVQWTGVAFEVAAVIAFFVWGAGEIGWIDPVMDGPFLAVALQFPGILLINSRREPSAPVLPEQQARNRRMLLITVAICTAVLGAALVIEFTGA